MGGACLGPGRQMASCNPAISKVGRGASGGGGGGRRPAESCSWLLDAATASSPPPLAQKGCLEWLEGPRKTKQWGLGRKYRAAGRVREGIEWHSHVSEGGFGQPICSCPHLTDRETKAGREAGAHRKTYSQSERGWGQKPGLSGGLECRGLTAGHGFLGRNP